METENFISGFPLPGAGLCAIAPECITPRWVSASFDTGKTRFATVVLGAILAGILLVLPGQLVTDVTMELESYHTCDLGGRRRVTDVLWNRVDIGCPLKSLGR